MNEVDDTKPKIMASSGFVPAIKPPQGQLPNLVDPISLKNWNTVCVSVCLSISTIVFALRTYVRIYIKRQWILEDCECSSKLIVQPLRTYRRMLLVLGKFDKFSLP